MNVVFMGTPDFAVPTLEKFNEDSEINISYVVTNPDAKSSRGLKTKFNPVKEKALELNLKILQPEKIKNDEETIKLIKEAKPDFIIVVSYGQILPKEILDIPKFACINGHASLLPKYRGASPIQTAILNGDKTTGVTTMLMDVGLDTGNILEQKEITIDEKETAETLFDKLSTLTSDLLVHTIHNFSTIESIKQDDDLACKCSIIKKEFGEIDFNSEDAVSIERKVRAYTSWPSAFVKSGEEILKIWDIDIVNEDVDTSLSKKFSDNIFILKDQIIAKCKTGFIRINELQKSGKKRVTAKEFINGLK